MSDPSARVHVLLTGGTLSMMRAESGGLEPTDFGPRLAELVPELAQVARVSARTLMRMDSSDLGPQHWQAMGQAIIDDYDAADGFVIVHGTDTMAFSASALSFMMPALDKPVVLTGSQRPIAEVRSDAATNLVDAVTVATMGIPEVMICMHATLLRGNRARKRSTIDFTAFDSPNFPPLARLGVTIDRAASTLPARGRPRALGQLVPEVALVTMTPATRAAELTCHAQLGTKGLVVQAFGAGNIATGRELVEALAALEIPVVVISQCRQGPVDLTRYVGGRALGGIGAIDGGEMTPEAALTKLMVGLGSGMQGDMLRAFIETPLAGERQR